jgi:hypothetical protein
MTDSRKLTNLLLAAVFVALLAIAGRVDIIQRAEAAPNWTDSRLYGCHRPYDGAPCRWVELTVDGQGRLNTVGK